MCQRLSASRVLDKTSPQEYSTDMENMVLVASPEALERYLAIKPEDDTAYVLRYSPATVLVRTKFPSAVMRRKWNQVREGVKGSRWVAAGS